MNATIPPRPVTIRTIAQAANVSIATVSRALRGVAGVSPAERERVRAVARRLGYSINPFVAAFTAQVRMYRRRPQAATIALLDCWPNERPVWANFDDSLDYMSGIRQRAEALGYRVERIRLADLGHSLDRLQRLLATRRIHGLLVLPVPEDTDLGGLDYTGLACATIDFSLQRPALMRRASSNYYQNMALTLSTLTARGYRRIGFVMTRFASQVQQDLGLAAFLSFRLIQPHTCVKPCLAANASTLPRDLAAWLNQERPDVVITSDLTLPDDLEATGRRVPEELACVYLATPPDKGWNVAYLDENYHMVGAQAVDMIVDAIHRNEFGLPSTRVVHFVDGFWQEGVTVRPIGRT